MMDGEKKQFEREMGDGWSLHWKSHLVGERESNVGA